GIYNNSTGAVNVTNCTLSGNFAGIGGAIYNNSSGQVNVTNSTISDNFTNQPDYGGGGGIFNNMGRLSVTNCTIKDNIARGNGGGIVNLNAQGTLNILNSTLTGNISTQDGGGISNNDIGTINVISSTISSNSASSIGGGLNNNGSGPFNVKSSIIALNTAAGSGPDVWGTFTSQGFNVVGIDQNNGFNTATDHKGGTNSPLDPKLDPNGLQNNGGPTQTIALLSNSPAINTGDPNPPPRDQRGYVRQNAADIG